MDHVGVDFLMILHLIGGIPDGNDDPGVDYFLGNDLISKREY